MSDHAKFLAKLAKQSRGHSIFSPSGSSMWAFCSGSLVPNIQIKDTAGIDAATGTVAHGLGELWLKTGIRPDHLIGTTETVVEGEGDNKQVFVINIDEEMMDYVEVYVDSCSFLPGDHFVETRVDFSDLTPIDNQGGTADHAACERGKLTITDLKFGLGIEVYAFENTQAILYAYGFFKKYDWYYDFQEIVIRICQPRRGHFDEWVITRSELLEWADWLKSKANDAWKLDAPRTPSEKSCQWCKIKTDCKAFAVWLERLTADVFDNLDLPIEVEDMADLVKRLDGGDEYTINPVDLNELTLEHKAAIYRNKSAVTSWFDKVGQDLYEHLERGEKVPHFKIVEGRSARIFSDQTRAFAELEFAGLNKDQIEPRVFISPAQSEKELIKLGYKRKQLPELLDPIVKRIAGSPTMVSDKDPRPSIRPDGEGVFDNLDDI